MELTLRGWDGPGDSGVHAWVSAAFGVEMDVGCEGRNVCMHACV
jgi:hypothetical protein